MAELACTASEPVVTLTQEAVRQVRRLMQRQSKEIAVLRVGVKGGGCTGYSYWLRLEERARESDIVYDQDGLTIVVDPKSAALLRRSTLDYSLSRMFTGGWVWTNPNAARSCGCGASFAVKR